MKQFVTNERNRLLPVCVFLARRQAGCSKDSRKKWFSGNQVKNAQDD